MCRFGEETMVKVANWLEDCEDVASDDSIIDLGTGNGMMCIELVSNSQQMETTCTACHVYIIQNVYKYSCTLYTSYAVCIVTL